MAPQGGKNVQKFDSRNVTPGIFAGMESEKDKVVDVDSDVPIKKEKNEEQGRKPDEDISQIKKEKSDEERGQHDEVDAIEEGEKYLYAWERGYDNTGVWSDDLAVTSLSEV